jgi:hypothetical protein
LILLEVQNNHGLVDFEDYLWNAPYASCVAKQGNQSIETLRANYLATAELKAVQRTWSEMSLTAQQLSRPETDTVGYP